MTYVHFSYGHMYMDWDECACMECIYSCQISCLVCIKKTKETLPKFSAQICITSYKNFTSDGIRDVQVGSLEEQKDFWLGEAPPVLHWAIGGDARQHGWQQRAAHEPWVQAVPSLVPACNTLQAEGTVDRRWLRWHRVLWRWRHGVRPIYSCRKVGGGRTNLRQSGKSIALFFYVKLHTNTFCVWCLYFS